MKNEKLLNVKEVSDLLNISKSSIYNYAKDKVIPSIKINGRLLFSQKVLDAWIDTKKQDAKN